MSRVPEAEAIITAELVRGLLHEQHPDLATLPLVPAAEGWDNVVFRLGDELAVRLPRRELAAGLVLSELRFVGSIAERTNVALPVPVRRGRPGRGYPWDWSVYRWTEGTPGLEVPAPERGGVGELAGFLGVLHTAAPPEAPENPFRGLHIGALDGRVRERLDLVEHRPDHARLVALWDRLSAAPAYDGPPVWVHGDLHPGNLLFALDGSLAGVIDFGDLCAGDPAVDLAVAWQLYPAPRRREFVAAVHKARPRDAATWERAAAWALNFGLLSVAIAGNDPAFATNGDFTLRELLAEFSGARSADRVTPAEDA
ncbi:aminoglycoside phosphotransferase family protein [Sinomonas sp. ASV322]|uniref:aminoglycoside phosphotransferase family protein n=1 Tax=Sinomonas sp. ASV322 TaxID=3041920 RepID=UPI0027DCBE79|nr:aminoglycoside phosphotransferase family protein [Sinomonas sp. ASV322]MDQ4504585.1 aminoglycoside phosphotransferase family protein [Sinomonas sp. ASV322]